MLILWFLFTSSLDVPSPKNDIFSRLLEDGKATEQPSQLSLWVSPPLNSGSGYGESKSEASSAQQLSKIAMLFNFLALGGFRRENHLEKVLDE